MASKRELKLKVGRGTQRGEVSLSAYLPELVTLSVSYKGDCAVSVVLTDEQVRELRRALDEVAPRLEAQGGERLRLAA